MTSGFLIFDRCAAPPERWHWADGLLLCPVQTTHRILIEDARRLTAVADQSVHLVVTSPPYPMIEMWDGMFSELSPSVRAGLAAENAQVAFEGMHTILDDVWKECHRTLVPGGLLCINIGDAVRTMGGTFRMYSNHSRIITAMTRLGFDVLPDILWRKPTNAPNKFMGSGMLPTGAYVTYEHEYVLIFRKGSKRAYLTPEEKKQRAKSAFFWEERNVWFSDLWSDLTGTRQALADAKTRSRSAAFPFELPYRLIQMHSVYGDTVLDPFLGIGTTLAAAIASGRNGIGVECDPSLLPTIRSALSKSDVIGRERVRERLANHRIWAVTREHGGKAPKHKNDVHGVSVVTKQEVDLCLLEPTLLTLKEPDGFCAIHAPVCDQSDHNRAFQALMEDHARTQHP